MSRSSAVMSSARSWRRPCGPSSHRMHSMHTSTTSLGQGLFWFIELVEGKATESPSRRGSHWQARPTTNAFADASLLYRGNETVRTDLLYH
jgi:hypothetical protein